jgi:hypothetical protein
VPPPEDEINEAGGKGSESPKPDGGRPETVDALVEQAKFHEEFEESRLHTNNQRAAWLLALDGVILGLAANQAREMLFKSSLLGSTGKWVAAISLFVAVLSVLVSAGCALKVIFRAPSWAWNLEEIQALDSSKSLYQEKAQVQNRFLGGLIERIREERDGYDRRKPWLERAFAALAVALVAVTVHIGVYSIRTVQSHCTPAATPTNSSQVFRRAQRPDATVYARLASVVTPQISDLPMPVGSLIERPKGEKCTR